MNTLIFISCLLVSIVGALVLITVNIALYVFAFSKASSTEEKVIFFSGAIMITLLNIALILLILGNYIK